MAVKKESSTYQKTLAINLDLQRYGVFAEIGAGQETANWFFRVSGSASKFNPFLPDCERAQYGAKKEVPHGEPQLQKGSFQTANAHSTEPILAKLHHF